MGTQKTAASPEMEDKVLSVMFVGTVTRLQFCGIGERNRDPPSDSL
jgi:hypothetical protein